MPQMNVSIPEALKSWAESRVAEGRYASTSDYIRDLIRRDQDAEDDRAWIDEAIDEGLMSPPSKLSISEIIASRRNALG